VLHADTVVDHGLQESRRVPGVVVHLLAQRATSPLDPGVQLGADRGALWQWNRPPPYLAHRGLVG
jgi:hypothetical protein